MSRPASDSYQDFTAHLQDREYFGQKLGLERIQRVLDRLGNPERKFKSIHIAGTNGKGSTAAMLASILKEAGYRVGLYTSPHLIDFCERVQVGGEQILPEQVLHLVRMINEVEEGPLTFFEMATAIAFLHFAEERVPIAVIETGLGGRLDATNVITPLVSVITSIGLDHTAHLGNTVEEIAFEKAGVIKPGVPVVVGELPKEAMKIVREVAPFPSPPAPLPPGREGSEGVRLGLAGEHQKRNAAVAVAVIAELRKKDFLISNDAIKCGLENVCWPGRLETIQQNPWILLDGAHNSPAMRAVREFLEPRLKGRRLKIIFGAMADKDIRGILAEIAPVTDEFIFTAPLLKRAANPHHLFEIARVFEKPASVVPQVVPAVESVLKSLQREEVLLVTGSLFVVGETRQWLQENFP